MSARPTPPSPRVVLMCGVAGAGKTTYAKELEAQGYVRLSIDEEIWERFGRYGVDYDPSMYEKHSAEAEAVLRQRLVDLIRARRDVVVDYSFWERSTRDRYKRLVVAAGGHWDLVYLKVSVERLRERLAARGARFDANAAFPISDAVLERFLAGFQEPNGEGETVVDAADEDSKDNVVRARTFAGGSHCECMSACTHVDHVRVTELPEEVPGCPDCLAAGGKWLHLRICLECGHVGCCDSSPNQHASAHARETDHPIARSIEPGEDWSWCYVDETFLSVAGVTGEPRIPPSPMGG